MKSDMLIFQAYRLEIVKYTNFVVNEIHEDFLR